MKKYEKITLRFLATALLLTSAMPSSLAASLARSLKKATAAVGEAAGKAKKGAAKTFKTKPVKFKVGGVGKVKGFKSAKGVSKFDVPTEGGGVQRFKVKKVGGETVVSVKKPGGKYAAATSEQIAQAGSLKKQFKVAKAEAVAKKTPLLQTTLGQVAIVGVPTVLGIAPTFAMLPKSQSEMEADAREAALGRALPVPGEEGLLYDPADAYSPGTVYIEETGLKAPGPQVYDAGMGTLTNMGSGQVRLAQEALEAAQPVPGQADMVFIADGRVFNKETGNMIAGSSYDVATGQMMTLTGIKMTPVAMAKMGVIEGKAEWVHDPANGQVYNKDTALVIPNWMYDAVSGQLMNMLSGAKEEPATGRSFDPSTGQWIDKKAAERVASMPDLPGMEGYGYDTAGIVYDKSTGQPAEMVYDAATGQLTYQGKTLIFVNGEWTPVEQAATAPVPAGTTPLPNIHGLAGYGYDAGGQVLDSDGAASGFMYDADLDQLYDPNDGAVRDPESGEWIVPGSAPVAEAVVVKPVVTTPLPNIHGLTGYGYDAGGRVFKADGSGTEFMYNAQLDQLYDPEDGAVRDPESGEWIVLGSAPVAEAVVKKPVVGQPLYEDFASYYLGQ